MRQSSSRSILIIILVAVLFSGWLAVSMRRQNALVVYCAHDLIFAEEILLEFEKQSGIKLVIVGDTEATKSLGLVQRLIREKEHSVCDVFWNNQTLGTMQLAEEDVLQPYKGSGYERIPKEYKDTAGRWVGFAGRLRVWIVNTDLSKLQGDELDALFQGNQSVDLSRYAIANPLYGTTLSHMSLYWNALGPESTQRWYQTLQDRGLQIVQGNATVKNLVAQGVCDAGWTDTDDYFVAKDDGYPVKMFPLYCMGETVCIPNSVAIIQGTQRLKEAQKLVDFLLSKETELKLAHSQARQIPLGPVDQSELPNEVKELAIWVKDSADITNPRVLQSRSECLEWLLKESSP